MFDHFVGLALKELIKQVSPILVYQCSFQSPFLKTVLKLHITGIKNFAIKTAVLQDLKKVDFELKTDDTEKYYTILKNIYPKIVKRQVCLKKDMLENAMLRVWIVNWIKLLRLEFRLKIKFFSSLTKMCVFYAY